MAETAVMRGVGGITDAPRIKLPEAVFLSAQAAGFPLHANVNLPKVPGKLGTATSVPEHCLQL